MKDLSINEKIELIHKHKDEIKKIQESLNDTFHNDASVSGLTPIGKYVRRLRVICGVTVTEMAHYLNVTVPYLAGVEWGRHTADIGYVIAINEFFANECDLYLSYSALLDMVADSNARIKKESNK